MSLPCLGGLKHHFAKFSVLHVFRSVWDTLHRESMSSFTPQPLKVVQVLFSQWHLTGWADGKFVWAASQELCGTVSSYLVGTLVGGVHV